jgi:hypothetical protein
MWSPPWRLVKIALRIDLAPFIQRRNVHGRGLQGKRSGKGFMEKQLPGFLDKMNQTM